MMAHEPGAADPGFMAEEEGAEIAKRVFALLADPWAEIRVRRGWWTNTAFARGDSHVMSQTGGTAVDINLRGCTVSTSQLDDDGLTAAITRAAEAAKQLREQPWWTLRKPIQLGARPKIYFDEVIPALASETRAALMGKALDATERAGLIGAGDVTVSTSSSYVCNSEGLRVYQRRSYGELTLTARTKDGRGSGWGWSGHEDWRRVNPDAVIARAVDLAQRSANPVAVEPGRYTVILEPTAVAALIGDIMWDARMADQGYTPFSKRPIGTNKIGLQMLDQRLQVTTDPWDQDMPDDIVDENGTPQQAAAFFKNGILRELDYDAIYAPTKGREPTYAPPGRRWFGLGPTQTLDEMIQSTKRGVWVNRLSNGFALSGRTHLITGTTRDGTFLIEDGRITKAIKNFRFSESPFFVLNKLEAFGEPERASRGIVAPRVRVRDFEFTSLTDAV